MLKKRFGFLIPPLSIQFDGVSVSPVAEHKLALNWLETHSNIDGYFYPPQACLYELDLRTFKPVKRVKQSERPAAVYHLPVSHEIELSAPIGQIDINFEDAGLIVHLLAYLYGTRLQFAEWRFEGRVPLKPSYNFKCSDETAAHFLEFVYGKWRSLKGTQRLKYVNILYIFTRARSLEWEWDAFIYQYMTFDALYDLHADLTGSRVRRHSERFKVMSDEYGVRYDEKLIKEICTLRNELFHGALWAGAPVGHGTLDSYTFHQPFNLARLNARLICALIGYRNEFSRSVWWAMGNFRFDRYRGRG